MYVNKRFLLLLPPLVCIFVKPSSRFIYVTVQSISVRLICSLAHSIILLLLVFVFVVIPTTTIQICILMGCCIDNIILPAADNANNVKSRAHIFFCRNVFSFVSFGGERNKKSDNEIPGMKKKKQFHEIFEIIWIFRSLLFKIHNGPKMKAMWVCYQIEIYNNIYFQ